MQLGPRAQNPFARQPDRAPMSAARLAAEAAFAAPNSAQPTAAAAASVVLRRSRLVAGQGPAAQHEAAAHEAAATHAAAGKNARVFRVQATPTNPFSPEAAAGAADAEPSAPTPKPPTRARRVGSDKRPGPVLMLVQAPVAVAAVVELPTPPLEDLLTQLNLAGQLLQAAERAQSFRLDTDSCAKEWQQLSHKIDSLREDIRSQLR